MQRTHTSSAFYCIFSTVIKLLYISCCNTHNMQLFRFAITRKHVSFLSVFIWFYNFVLSDIKFIEKRKRINDRHLSFSCTYVVIQSTLYVLQLRITNTKSRSLSIFRIIMMELRCIEFFLHLRYFNLPIIYYDICILEF